MKLLLDIGNSSVNWASEKKSKFLSQGSFIYDKENVEGSLKNNLSLTKETSKILLSNVAGLEVYNSLNCWIKKHGDIELWQSSVDEKFKGLSTSYTESKQIGIDRWLAMVASWDKYHSSLCVVNCGTALTIDLVDIHGHHLGGYIMPGAELMHKALMRNTDKINVSMTNIASLDYASNTQAAVNNGVFLALVSAIERIVNKFSVESGVMPKCIISGGNAELIEPLLEYQFEFEPNLVLRGLLIAHNTSI
ncbi:MAG: hypothetical protein CMF40_02540 [Legionellales bacterium]|nr:hypothetical protein [Legionellales bacterium]|tara:strand:- start:30 stop:776 length:747 start_codon:yes stop_codon:yes gene_type:complete